ncbi:hypothetical protein [Geomonas subterranea]|uniref:hypothetical protein n=1 Tax=Geomonas subterranea TaxID=2847989 RepID=UPI001CD3425A|nr:hypothetical protein [Geomonas fuzhouensis]
MVIALLQALRESFPRGRVADQKQHPPIDYDKIIFLAEATTTQLKAENSLLLNKLNLHLDRHHKVLLHLEDALKDRKRMLDVNADLKRRVESAESKYDSLKFFVENALENGDPKEAIEDLREDFELF